MFARTNIIRPASNKARLHDHLKHMEKEAGRKPTWWVAKILVEYSTF